MQSKDNTKEYKIGDLVRSGRDNWKVVGYVGSKYLLQQKINYVGDTPYTKTIFKVRSGWRIKKVTTNES